MSAGIAIAGVGVVAFYLMNKDRIEQGALKNDIKGWTDLLPGATGGEENPTCPEGLSYNPNDGLCYPPQNTTTCADMYGEGWMLSADKKDCLPPPGTPDSLPPNPCAGTGENGEDLEFWPKEDGGDDMCHYPDGQPTCPNGYVWRDGRCMRGHPADIGLSSLPLAGQIVAETALSYAAYAALDAGARGVYRVGQNAATAVNQTVNASRSATQNAARQAARESARAAQQAAQAARAAAATARTTRFGLMMARMSGTPFGLIFMIIAQILIAVLGLNPDEFELCRANEFDVASLPDWARILIESIPFAGDLFSMIAPTICIRTGCEPPNVEQHGLCYPPPRENFWCEAFLCYSQHPTWEANGQLHTTTHITKNIPMDTGTIPLSCPEGSRLDGLLCYRVPEWAQGEGNPGVNIVAGVAWENCRPGMTDTGVRCEDVHGGGVGQLRVVPAGWVDDGLTAREPIRGYPCPGGWIEEPLTCREPLRGGNCEPVHCHSVGDCFAHGRCGCWGGNCHPITGGRVEGRRMGGGRVEGRGAGSSLPCPANTSPGYDGLCYENCREGFRREGLLCSRSYNKRSEVLPPFSPSCPADRIDGGPWGSAGLCYMANLPEGYRRVVAGTIEQMCPTSPPEWGHVEENVLDIGVGCQRARYNRGAGTVPFDIRVKARRNPQQAPPLPPSCDERRALFASLDAAGQYTHEEQLCIEAPCAADEDMTGDGMACVPRCRDGFRAINRGEDVYCARDATADAPAEEYRQRPIREIDFGFY